MHGPLTRLTDHPRAALTLGLVGYSTRALAAAVAECGFQAVALDAFCDADTRQVARCTTIEHWPEQILSVAARVNCDAWLLAGGLENHGRIVQGLASRAAVLGPTRSQLRQLRRLNHLAELVVGIDGLAFPETARDRRRFADRPHLFKPFRSAGGLAVRHAWPASSTREADTQGRGYWQAWVPGRVLGITCIVREEKGGQPFVSWCGATESLQADDWPGPQPYAYRGSLGPVDLTPEQQQAAIALAGRIGSRLKYRGWLQADFIESPDGRLWLLEFNPRWTAGMELLQACLPRDRKPLIAHLNSWGIAVPQRTPTDTSPHQLPPGTMDGALASAAGYRMAKAIFYADRACSLSGELLQRLPQFQQRQRWQADLWWDIADIPEPAGPGQCLPVSAGQPLLTLRCGSDTGKPYPRGVWLEALREARTAIAVLLNWA